MNEERYDLAIGKDFHSFKFISEGPRGKIYKMIVFKPLSGLDGFYNLSLGDWDEVTQTFDDAVVSDNGDTLKVLGTVAKAVDCFLEANPHAVVFASGSNAVRNRLYRMIIQKHLGEIRNRFVIRGRIGKKWQTFKKGGKYDAYTLFRK